MNKYINKSTYIYMYVSMFYAYIYTPIHTRNDTTARRGETKKHIKSEAMRDTSQDISLHRDLM